MLGTNPIFVCPYRMTVIQQRLNFILILIVPTKSTYFFSVEVNQYIRWYHPPERSDPQGLSKMDPKKGLCVKDGSPCKSDGRTHKVTLTDRSGGNVRRSNSKTINLILSLPIINVGTVRARVIFIMEFKIL